MYKSQIEEQKMLISNSLQRIIGIVSISQIRISRKEKASDSKSCMDLTSERLKA